MTKRLLIFSVVTCLGIGLLCLGCKKKEELPPSTTVSESAAGNGTEAEAADESLTGDQKRIKAMIKSEKLLLSLAKQIDVLNRWFQDQTIDLSDAVANELKYSGIGLGDDGKFDFEELVSDALVLSLIHI